MQAGCSRVLHVRRLGLRALSSGAKRAPPVASHVGVLHVYKLEPASVPVGNDAKLRMLLPSPDTTTSAEQLARAADSGEIILVPERSLSNLLADASGVGQLDAGDEEAQRLLGGAGAEGGRSAGTLNQLAEGGDQTTDALALAEQAIPLSEALARGVDAAPDWRSTAELAREEAAGLPPTDVQHVLLNAAARGAVAELSAAIAACPPSEFASATLAPSGATPLHLAASSGEVDACRILLDAGCAVDVAAANGSSALHWAAGSGNDAVVRLLLRAGASTRTRSSTWRSTVRGNDSGQTPAHWAAASGHTAALEALLAEDPAALIMEDERQMAPAAVAARDGHPWLQAALSRLETERVVCVRVRREATLQRPIDGASFVAGRDDAPDEQADSDVEPPRLIR